MGKTLEHWNEDRVPRVAAAFSFYAALSMAPLLLLAVVVAGMIFGEGMAREELLDQARQAVGPQGQEFVAELLDNARRPGASVIATLVSLAVTFFSASNLFIALQESMDAIWNIERKRSMFQSLIFSRLTAFLSVLLFAALVIAWLALDAWLSWLERNTPGFQGGQLASLAVSILFLTGVFSLTFRQLPANRMTWRDVWPGACVTAVGITLSKFLLALYFSFANVSAAYGSAGALVVILLWLYYTSQIFFFGVELTYTYSHEFGSLRDQPKRGLSYS
jgi:membrane protein